MFPKVLVVWRSLVDVRSEATRLLVGTVVPAREHHRGAAHLPWKVTMSQKNVTKIGQGW